jgi:hypothetical protein
MYLDSGLFPAALGLWLGFDKSGSTHLIGEHLRRPGGCKHHGFLSDAGNGDSEYVHEIRAWNSEERDGVWRLHALLGE